MVCQVCGKEFEKTTWNKKYCSVKCRNTTLNQKKATKTHKNCSLPVLREGI